MIELSAELLAFSARADHERARKLTPQDKTPQDLHNALR
jgi:hypothetical protein